MREKRKESARKKETADRSMGSLPGRSPAIFTQYWGKSAMIKSAIVSKLLVENGFFFQRTLGTVRLLKYVN